MTASPKSSRYSAQQGKALDGEKLELREYQQEALDSLEAMCANMNKLHWISVLFPDAPDDIVQFLVNVSYEATKIMQKKK